MATELHIFISSKMRELAPERQALQDLLPALDRETFRLRTWAFEQNAPASNKSIRDVYLDINCLCEFMRCLCSNMCQRIRSFSLKSGFHEHIIVKPWSLKDHIIERSRLDKSVRFEFALYLDLSPSDLNT